MKSSLLLLFLLGSLIGEAQSFKHLKVCSDSFPVTLQVNDTLNASYLWSTGDTSSSVAVPVEGDYTVTITVDSTTTVDSFFVEEWGAPGNLSVDYQNSGLTYFFWLQGDFVDSNVSAIWTIDTDEHLGQSVVHVFPWLNPSQDEYVFMNFDVDVSNQCGSEFYDDHLCYDPEPFGNGIIISGDCSPAGVEVASTVELKVFPNPTSSRVSLSVSRTAFESFRLEDVSGKNQELVWTSDRELFLDHLSPGIYILSTESSFAVSLTRLIIQ